MYPRTDGPHIVIGPECFAAEDRSVLCWQGVNYVPQDTYQGAVSALDDALKLINTMLIHAPDHEWRGYKDRLETLVARRNGGQ